MGRFYFTSGLLINICLFFPRKTMPVLPSEQSKLPGIGGAEANGSSQPSKGNH